MIARRLRWWRRIKARREITRRLLDQMAADTGRMNPADIPATHIHTRGPDEGKPIA